MKNKQGITIAALIIAIVGLSIGFAAFSNTLTISSSATVNPSDENFIVQFSKYSDSDATGELNPITPTALTSDYGENGLIPDSNKKALQNLHAKFTAPGQSVTYELYVRNTGAYVAYLKELAFANATNATNGETYKHCYAATTDSNNQPISSENQATASLVTQACNGIDISVTIGTASNITPDSPSKSLGNQALQANGGYVQAIITISYDSNAAYVDGPMEVEFGTISFTASSNQGSSQGSQEQSGGETSTNSPTFVVSSDGYIMDYLGTSSSVEIPARANVVEVSGDIDMESCVARAGQSQCEQMQNQIQNKSEGYLQTINDLISVGWISNLEYTETNNEVNITGIGYNAFYEKNISNVDFSGAINLQTIAEGAFNGNNITSVTIPYTVTTIESNAFENNPLVTIVIGDSTNGSNITEIGAYAFNPGDTSTIQSVTIYRSSNGVSVNTYNAEGSASFGSYDITNSWHPVS